MEVDSAGCTLTVTHVPVAPPFMYDKMNSILLMSSGNSDPCRCMYVEGALRLKVVEVILQTCEWSRHGNLWKLGRGGWQWWVYGWQGGPGA